MALSYFPHFSIVLWEAFIMPRALSHLGWESLLTFTVMMT